MESKTAWLTDILQEAEVRVNAKLKEVSDVLKRSVDRAWEKENLLTQAVIVANAVSWKDETINTLRQKLSNAQTDADYQRKICGDLKSELKDRDFRITELLMERIEPRWLKLPKTLPSQPPKEVEKRRFQQKWVVEYQGYSSYGPWYQSYDPWVKGTFDSEAEALAAIAKDKFKGVHLIRRARCAMIPLE